MVSKSKRVLALVLTAMMASAALAGCGPTEVTQTQNSTAKETTESKAAGDSAESGDGESKASAEAVNIYSDDMIKNVKDKMKEEAAQTDGVISLKVWCSGDDLQFEKKLIKDFEELYKSDDGSYSFKIKASGAIGEDNAGGKIIESPQDGADVFNFADDQLSTLVEAKAIAQVSDVFQNNLIANNTEDAVGVCSINGTPYAFPKTSDNGYFLYYDKRVFKDDSEVASFDDMIQKANSNKKSVYFNLTNPWYNAGVYFTAGVKIEYKDGKQTTTFDSDEGLAAAKAMCHLAESSDKGFLGTAGSSGDNAAVQKGFKEGTLAAAVIGTWMGPAIKKAIGEENVGAAKLPTILINGEQKQTESFGGYKIVGVNQFSKYQITSQALAYFLTRPESQLKRYEERGLIPTSNEALADDKVKVDPALKAINDQKAYAHAQGKSVSGVYWASNVGGFGGEIVAAKGKIDDATLKKSLKDLDEQINK